ncbi:hypothetical protein ACP70R_019137 [Stipagrostis hirtigluma subsp. patula]
MAFYRRLLVLRRLSHLHPSPAPAVSSAPPPTLAGLLTPLGRRHFAFASAEEAAAERRRRKRRLRIEPPLHALRRDPPPPRDPSAPRLPDTTSALVGPRLSLHNRVQSLIRSGDLDGASVAARAAVSSRVRPTVFTCNAVAASMVRAARHDDAVELFEFFFRRSNIVPNVVSYNTLILAHCEAGRVDDAIQVYHDMLASAPFSPSAVTYRHLTKGLVAAGRIRDALDLLREMLNRGQGADSLVFNNLIAGYIDLGEWDKAFELFNELRERCLVYDGVVHTTFMEGYWKQGKDKEAMDNYQSLLDQKFKMTPATCNVLLETLFKHDKHKEANDLWETMIDNHTPPSFIGINAESYNVMVNQCFKEGKFQEAIEVFHRQPRKNVQMDVGCFNNIIGKLCENGMLAEAEKLFEEMETKSVLPDVYTYTYLVDSCFKEGRVDDTMQYFYKMADGREHGPKFNIGFFNRMFEGLTEAGRLDDALKVYGRMPDKEIKPNTTTFEVLVKAFCKEGDLDRARDLVMDMARGGVVPSPEFRESVVDIFKNADRQEKILQVKLLNKLRNELRISHSENKEVLVKVISDEHIKSLRNLVWQIVLFLECWTLLLMHMLWFITRLPQLDRGLHFIYKLPQFSSAITNIRAFNVFCKVDIGILGSANRAKEGSCFEPHTVVSAKRLKSVNGHALAYIKCSPSAELPVAVSAVMAKSCTDDTLVSETFSFEVKTGCNIPPVFHEKHSQSNAGHIPSCVDHGRKESGKRKPKEPVMRGSKNKRRRKQEKDSDLDIGSEIIKLCLTAKLLNKVEKIFRENPDPGNLETAKSMLKVQEKELLDALVKLSEVSYGVAYLSAEGQPANLSKDDEEVPPKPASSSDETPPETRPGDGGAENNAKIQGVAAAAASPSATRPQAPASPSTAASTDMASSSEGDQPRLAPAGTQGVAPPGPGRGKVNRRWKPSTRVFGADWLSFG